MSRYLPVLAALATLAGCGSAPAPAPAPAVQAPRVDPVTEAWYSQSLGELQGIVREAEGHFAAGRSGRASEVVPKGQPLADRLLAVPRPTLAAIEAASDLDDLYGRMLLADRKYGWARMVFQKNAARWKHWRPQTSETERRLKQANSKLAECDRLIGQ